MKKGGERIDVSVAVSPVRDGAGNIVGASTIARDISERKRAEKERERLLAEVQRRAAELDVSNRELQSFAYSVAHDLRAPLRHINAFSQRLLQEYVDRLDDSGKGHLQFLSKASQKLGRLIDDLLKLSRVTRAEVRRQPVNLSELAQAVVTALRTQQPQRQAEVTIAPGVVATGDPPCCAWLWRNCLAMPGSSAPSARW